MSDKHYDFGVIEHSARNRMTIDKMTNHQSAAVTEIETDSNSTLSQV